MTRDGGLSPGVIYELVAQAGFRKYFHFWGPQVDRQPDRSLSRGCLRPGNIKEGLDMIEEYVNSR